MQRLKEKHKREGLQQRIRSRERWDSNPGSLTSDPVTSFLLTLHYTLCVPTVITVRIEVFIGYNLT